MSNFRSVPRCMKNNSSYHSYQKQPNSAQDDIGDNDKTCEDSEQGLMARVCEELEANIDEL